MSTQRDQHTRTQARVSALLPVIIAVVFFILGAVASVAVGAPL